MAKFVDRSTGLRNPLVMATGFPAGLAATSHGLVWPAAAFFQHGGSAENTVITEAKRGARRAGLHHVAAEAIHQTRRIETQQQTDVDAAHAQVWRCTSIANPITRSVSGSASSITFSP